MLRRATQVSADQAIYLGLALSRDVPWTPAPVAKRRPVDVTLTLGPDMALRHALEALEGPSLQCFNTDIRPTYSQPPGRDQFVGRSQGARHPGSARPSPCRLDWPHLHQGGVISTGRGNGAPDILLLIRVTQIPHADFRDCYGAHPLFIRKDLSHPGGEGVGLLILLGAAHLKHLGPRGRFPRRHPINPQTGQVNVVHGQSEGVLVLAEWAR